MKTFIVLSFILFQSSFSSVSLRPETSKKNETPAKASAVSTPSSSNTKSVKISSVSEASKEAVSNPNDTIKVSLSFRKTRIQDLIATLNAAYSVNIVLEKGLEANVDLHLENLALKEALEVLCKSQNWELTQNGSLYYIQAPTQKSTYTLEGNHTKIDLNVENEEVSKFIRDFAKQTGLKLLVSPGLEGRITGGWKNQPALDGFKALMYAHNYEIKRKQGFLIVSKGEGGASVGKGTKGKSRRASLARNRRSSGNLDVDYHNGLLTINLENADLSEVLKSIAKEADLNIIFYGDVKEVVNAQVKDLSIEEAFSAVMKGSRYTYIKTNDGTILVGSKDPKTESGKILTTYELYNLKHIKAEDVVKLLPRSIPASGLIVHKEQNAVLVSGTTIEIEGIIKYLKLIDKPAPQVMLECIIVEFSRGDNDEFGVRSSAPQSVGENGEIIGGSTGPNVTGTFMHSGEKVLASGGLNGMRGSVGVLPLDFQLELSALESENKAKVLAMPKITTLNGHKSNIKVSTTSQYPVNTISKDGFPINSFKSVESGITLDITPFITKDGEITIDINPVIKTAKVSSSADRPSDISSRSLKTTIRLRDGETAMLGGLIQNNLSKIKEGVPLLGSIPILGWLFSYYKDVEQTTELVIFVTPKVVIGNGGYNPYGAIKNIEENMKSRDPFMNRLQEKDETMEKNTSTEKVKIPKEVGVDDLSKTVEESKKTIETKQTVSIK